MKKLLSLLTCACVALTLCACGAKFDAGAALKAVKNFDVEAMQQYYGDDVMDELFAGTEKITNDEAGLDKNHPLAKILTSKMSYKIVDSVENEDGTEVSVTAEITNWPAATLYAKLAVNYGLKIAANLSASDEVKADLLNQAFTEVTEGATTNTDTITFKMTNNGENWRVAPADTAKIIGALLA